MKKGQSGLEVIVLTASIVIISTAVFFLGRGFLSSGSSQVNETQYETIGTLQKDLIKSTGGVVLSRLQWSNERKWKQGWRFNLRFPDCAPGQMVKLLRSELETAGINITKLKFKYDKRSGMQGQGNEWVELASGNDSTYVWFYYPSGGIKNILLYFVGSGGAPHLPPSLTYAGCTGEYSEDDRDGEELPDTTSPAVNITYTPSLPRAYHAVNFNITVNDSESDIAWCKYKLNDGAYVNLVTEDQEYNSPNEVAYLSLSPGWGPQELTVLCKDIYDNSRIEKVDFFMIGETYEEYFAPYPMMRYDKFNTGFDPLVPNHTTQGVHQQFKLLLEGQTSSTPVLADLTGDGIPEIILTLSTTDWESGDNPQVVGTVNYTVVIEANGTELWRNEDLNCESSFAATVVDIVGDSKPEILTSRCRGGTDASPINYSVLALDTQGTVVWQSDFVGVG